MIRNLENVITFVPVLSMSNKEIKKMVRIFKKVLLNQYRVESEGGASR